MIWFFDMSGLSLFWLFILIYLDCFVELLNLDWSLIPSFVLFYFLFCFLLFCSVCFVYWFEFLIVWDLSLWSLKWFAILISFLILSFFFFLCSLCLFFLFFDYFDYSYCWLSLQFWFWKKLFFCFWFWFLFSCLSFEVRKWF